MKRYFGMLGSFFGLLSVVLGAIGAHALAPHLTSDQLTSFEIGVKYQMYHAILMILMTFVTFSKKHMQKLMFIFLSLGIIFFSWSIFLLSTNDLTSLDFSSIFWIMPFGGFLLIFAWLLLFFNFYKKNNN